MVGVSDGDARRRFRRGYPGSRISEEKEALSRAETKPTEGMVYAEKCQLSNCGGRDCGKDEAQVS